MHPRIVDTLISGLFEHASDRVSMAIGFARFHRDSLRSGQRYNRR